MTSALASLGPHLLGCIPSPIDLRDYRVESYLGDGSGMTPGEIQALLDESVTHAKRTTVGWLIAPGKPHSLAWQNNTTTEWWQHLDGIARARAAIGGTPPPPPPPPGKDVRWPDPKQVLDQGQKGTCVGNGCAQFSNTLPVGGSFTEGDGTATQSALKGGPYARAVYYEATVFDGSPDNPDTQTGGQQGATVRSGMKALKARGRIDAYAVTQSVDTIRAWVQTKGPVVMGTGWTQSMFSPDSGGYVHPSGADVGGHCYLCAGDLVTEDAGWFLNSWSNGWALGGYFKMKWADVAARLSGWGEAWTAVELPL